MGSSHPQPNLLRACGGFLLVVGALCVAWGVRAWMAHAASAGWSRVPARILTAELREDYSADSGTTYTLDCAYEYEAGGRLQRSTRVAPFGGSSSQRSALAGWQHDLEAHKTSGTPWLAFVDPADPSRSLLVRDFSTMMLLTIPGGLLLGALGLHLVLAAGRGRDRTGA